MLKKMLPGDCQVSCPICECAFAMKGFIGAKAIVPLHNGCRGSRQSSRLEALRDPAARSESFDQKIIRIFGRSL